MLRFSLIEEKPADPIPDRTLQAYLNQSGEAPTTEWDGQDLNLTFRITILESQSFSCSILMKIGSPNKHCRII